MRVTATVKRENDARRREYLAIGQPSCPDGEAVQRRVSVSEEPSLPDDLLGAAERLLESR
ncbi:hypothetical protein [Nonomuraea sediminis]|uniref:hypothetical protein n=1 Tax=Nonomuraea sediminis TaxID=2835864 RepID=UPI001BDD480A|nr:hypothetical protein [Nonomuraea sediminis]